MKKRRVYISFVIIVAIVGNIFAFKSLSDNNDKKLKEKEKEDKIVFNGFKFKDITELDFGTYTLQDFIDDRIVCNEDSCTYKDKKLDYFITKVEELGNQKIEVKITYDDKTYSRLYDIEVKDLTSPTIELAEEEIEINLSDDFSPEEFLKEIRDNYDKDIKDRLVVDNPVDINKEGDYVVSYTITDSHGNKSIKELKVRVKKPQSEVTTTTAKGSTTTKVGDKTTTTKKSTTKKVTTTTTASATFKDKVNAIKLNPVKTGDSTFDGKINKIVAEINSKYKTNYDKLLGAYDYVMDYLSYQTVWLSNDITYDLMNKYGMIYEDAWTITLANQALIDHTGVCDSYAALFMMITRNLGFDSYFVGGRVKSTKGGTTGHAWNIIKISGTDYVFDAQIEDSKNGKQRLVYFGKTYKQLNIYSDYTVRKTNLFKPAPKVSTTITLTGATTDSKTFELKSNNYSRSDKITLKVGDTINIGATISGTSKYKIVLSDYDEEKYDKRTIKTLSNSPLSHSYTFSTPGTYYFYVDVTETTFNRSYEYYYTFEVTS